VREDLAEDVAGEDAHVCPENSLFSGDRGRGSEF
jgi:hypothetical protein